jgi:hypothetical protein
MYLGAHFLYLLAAQSLYKAANPADSADVFVIFLLKTPYKYYTRLTVFLSSKQSLISYIIFFYTFFIALTKNNFNAANLVKQFHIFYNFYSVTYIYLAFIIV